MVPVIFGRGRHVDEVVTPTPRLSRFSDLMTGVSVGFSFVSRVCLGASYWTQMLCAFDPPCKIERSKFSLLTGIGVFANIFEWSTMVSTGGSFVFSCSK